MEASLARHDELLRSSIEAHGGYVFSTAGDAFSAAFATSGDAVAAALAAQRALQGESWPAPTEIRVRMGLHVGAAHERGGDYFGSAVNRAARVMALARGGQIVVSEAVQHLVRHELPEGARLVGLGRHALRGMSEPESVFQLRAPDLLEEFAPLAASKTVSGNLPLPATSFVGRVDQVKRLSAELAGRRLVTLFGPGGVGKTRLAIEAAAAAVDDYPDGVWFVELASVTDPAAVAHATCAVLGTRPQEGMDSVDAVVDALVGRRALVVLDNAEHVLAAVAELVSRVIARVATATIMATSREPLGTAGELVWTVPSLHPALEAVDLFYERAALADAAFSPADGDRGVIEGICAHLDGIPLAIELAAARVRSMTLPDLAERLDDRFRLLRGHRTGGGLERHQTLRAMVDWSYRLLSDDEALLFERLSVFAGSFDLAAAEAVCADERLDRADLFELLAALTDRSMLSADRTGPHVRWRLLETLRQYGEEKLDQRGETAPLRDRHLAHFVTAAAAAHRAYTGRKAAEGVAAFESAWDNLRAALGWALATGDTASAVAIVHGSIWYCYFGLQAEHGDWVARVRELVPDDVALTGMAGMWASLQGDQEAARVLGQAAVGTAASGHAAETLFGWMAVTYSAFYSSRLEIAAPQAAEAAANNSPDPFVRAVVASFSCLGVFATDEASGLAGLARACDLAAALDNDAALAFANYQTGNMQFAVGNYDSALAAYERCIELSSHGNVRMFELWARTMLAARATDAGWPDAEQRFADSLRYLADNRIWSRVYAVLASLADYWCGADRVEPAATLIGFLELRDPIGLFLVARQRERAVDKVNAHPDAVPWKARGATLDRNAIIDYALAELASPS